jgi:hypothetical protein
MLVHMHTHVKSLVQADWVMHFQNGGEVRTRTPDQICPLPFALFDSENFST